MPTIESLETSLDISEGVISKDRIQITKSKSCSVSTQGRVDLASHQGLTRIENSPKRPDSITILSAYGKPPLDGSSQPPLKESLGQTARYMNIHIYIYICS